jgi:hypothetical protein
VAELHTHVLLEHTQVTAHCQKVVLVQTDHTPGPVTVQVVAQMQVVDLLHVLQRFQQTRFHGVQRLLMWVTVQH